MENVSILNHLEIQKKNISIWYLITYFIFYSFIGFLLETSFGLYTKGVVESRQSFLFGPFCIIYGIGAVLMIVFLSNLKEKNIKLFLSSSLLGIITEYSMSYFCEKFFHFKWWDYTGMILNIHGRTCLYFAIMWGILGLILINWFNPFLNKVIKWISKKVNHKVLKVSISLLIGFLIFDASISALALKSFYAKIVNDFDLDLTTSEYSNLYLDNDLFKENNMLLTYPNIQIARNKI